MRWGSKWWLRGWVFYWLLIGETKRLAESVVCLIWLMWKIDPSRHLPGRALLQKRLPDTFHTWRKEDYVCCALFSFARKLQIQHFFLHPARMQKRRLATKKPFYLELYLLKRDTLILWHCQFWGHWYFLENNLKTAERVSFFEHWRKAKVCLKLNRGWVEHASREYTDWHEIHPS